MSETREPGAGLRELPMLLSRLGRDLLALLEERLALASEEWQLFVAQIRGAAVGFALGVAGLLVGTTLLAGGVLLWLSTWLLAPAWVLFLAAGGAAAGLGLVLILVLARSLRGTELLPHTRATLAEDREWLARKQ